MTDKMHFTVGVVPEDARKPIRLLEEMEEGASLARAGSATLENLAPTLRALVPRRGSWLFGWKGRD